MIFPWSKNWVRVKSFEITANSPYVYHIHLYETKDGKRKATYFCDGKKYIPEGHWLGKQPLFQMKITRWLEGRRDPDIPGYNDIDEEDTVNYLKGKV
jgi:hypothetical protein